MQVFTSVVVLGVFFAVFIISDIKSYKERKAESMNSLAQVIAANSVSALQFQDNETATGLLKELCVNSPDIVHAVIYDVNGKLFARYSKPGVDTAVFVNLRNKNTTVFAGNQLFISNLIRAENELIGTLSLQVELSELTAIKRGRAKLVTILLLAAVAFAFLVALIVQTYISRRLLNLVNTMIQVRKTGNYVTVPDNGKDEISTLIQAFNKLMVEVKESQQKKDEFIGIASHELKTPLTSIKGYLDLLNSIEEKSANRLFVQKSLESVQKLERLIKDLLDVSKIQSGQLQLNLKSFVIDELINETVQSLQAVSPAHTLTCKHEVVGQRIYGDRQRIEQVLINLLSNAVKYSPGETEVLISSKRSGDAFIIQVRDYGIGIPDEDLSRIFERFYRTSGSASHISGFGLGLYICRDIIYRHRGEIWAQNEETGTSFFISLPIQHETELLQPAEETIKIK